MPGQTFFQVAHLGFDQNRRFIRLCANEAADTDELASMLGMQSAELSLTLNKLAEVVKTLLTNGRPVQLEGLVTFSLSASPPTISQDMTSAEIAPYININAALQPKFNNPIESYVREHIHLVRDLAGETNAGQALTVGVTVMQINQWGDQLEGHLVKNKIARVIGERLSKVSLVYVGSDEAVVGYNSDKYVDVVMPSTFTAATGSIELYFSDGKDIATTDVYPRAFRIEGEGAIFGVMPAPATMNQVRMVHEGLQFSFRLRDSTNTHPEGPKQYATNQPGVTWLTLLNEAGTERLQIAVFAQRLFEDLIYPDGSTTDCPIVP
jgi:nucleoid DNA-binding protein